MAKLAIAVGTSITAPSAAPAATEANHAAAVTTLSATAWRKPQSFSPPESLDSVTP